MADVRVRYGGKQGQAYGFSTSSDYLVVRTRSRAPLAEARLAGRSRAALEGFVSEARFVEHGVEILRAVRGGAGARDAARATLGKDSDVQFAGRVLVPADGKAFPAPVLYTENLFVKFADQVKPTEVKRLVAAEGLEVKRRIPWSRNALFLGAPEGIGRSVFEIADRLLERPAVELCHPEVVRERALRGSFAQQWHLKRARINGQTIDAHAHVTRAWRLAKGKGTTIAVVDDGVDVDHPEFAQRGSVVAPRDVTQGSDDPRPGRDDDHGTACAGVACADGRHGASGVAPAARLMPIRLASALGSMNEAEAFVWAADHGADVISCSWGPRDGRWWDPRDPLHRLDVPLPDSTRLAIEHAVSKGRRGLGCLICFASGNGNESVDLDGYARGPNVIAVAACNDTGRRSVYSDFGRAVFCAFPSNDFEDPATRHPAPLTPGIWTTDRSGNAGYNPGGGDSLGDGEGHYTSGFGGTSSACPGVAGVIALVLSENRNLRIDEVRAILRESCDRIDEAGGRYDAEGRSPFYGYGRVNAYQAVRLAAR